MIKRRHFLQATLATAGAVIGCGGNETGTTTGDTTTTTTPPRTLEDGAKYFPQSVASGDPRPDSVILWTRLEDTGEDLDLELEVSPDAEFTELVSLDGQKSLALKAAAAFDHCVKVRLEGISAATVYYYRFVYAKGGKFYASKVGRTKTAPAKGADAPLKFAFVSCQDYNGRFYNPYVRLVREELDFFVHLGDYVYETNGDPQFQSTGGRRVQFTDEKAAIELGSGDKKFFAAKTLSNYRDLYRTYRSDAALQAMHESFPMIATWDDHEFSDDSHGAVASYFDGAKDETDVDRRKSANQAWFEYMPVDYLDNPGFKYDPAKDFPGDIQIWRDFEFGKHLHLVMTDLRSYRADHLIPEDAYPGTVVVDEATLMADLGALPAIARPYVDIDAAKWSSYKTLLTKAATAGGADVAKVTGNISVLFINGVVAKVNDGTLPIDDAMAMDLPKGVAYIDAGKLSYFSSVGSRYFIVKPAFDILAKQAYKTKKNQEVMGTAQESWFLSTMTGATTTWKVWGNEYCLSPLQIDLSTQSIPEQFKQQFYMNCDAWDGFRDKRSELLGKLSALSNVVAVTGDIHAFYAGTPMTNDDPTKKIVEFVGGSISSGTFKSLVQSQVAADPELNAVPGAGALAAAVDALLKAGINSHLGFADSGRNGFVVVDVAAADLVATYYRIAEAEVAKDHSGDKDADLDKLFEVATFKTVAGEHELYMLQDDGKYKKWNPETKKYE
jgi:alkaline phosphatase D